MKVLEQVLSQQSVLFVAVTVLGQILLSQKA